MRATNWALRGVVGISLTGLVACGGAAASPTPSARVGASPEVDTGFSAGDMLLVTADVGIRDARRELSPVAHVLAPGDRVLVRSGPVDVGGVDWYEVAHHGVGGFIPAADVALDAPDPNATVWDLVTFGESSSPPSDMIAERIEQRLGVEVRIHDFAGAGTGGAAPNVLNLIQTDEDARTAIAEAETIVIEMNPGLTATGDAVGSVCIDNDPTPRDPPAIYAIEDFAEYADLWRQVYDEVFTLRGGQSTVVRAVDFYVAVLDGWRAAGIQAECTAAWEAFSGTVKSVAAEYGVPVASVYDAFNGANHDEDPVGKGWIGTDGEHPSEEGRAVQVDVLDALGWEPVGG